MKRLTILILLAATAFSGLRSQNAVNSYLFGHSKAESPGKNLTIYGGLTHQHQDFFDQVFSFTGIETGVLLKRNFLFGAYGSSFISNLKVEISNSKKYYYLEQGGFVFGINTNSQKLLHAGLLLNIGFFSFIGNSSAFSVFDTQSPSIKISGMVNTPQAFAELNIFKWMKFRTGLGYSFYSFNSHSVISKSDLQHVSLNFGFLFGKFSL